MITMHQINAAVAEQFPAALPLAEEDYENLHRSGSVAVSNVSGTNTTRYEFVVEHGHRVGVDVTVFETDAFDSPFQQKSLLH